MSKHLVITHAQHHVGIPLGIKQSGKTLIHIVESAPAVERRSLAVYDCFAVGRGPQRQVFVAGADGGVR
jgi:hypothetical protein